MISVSTTTTCLKKKTHMRRAETVRSLWEAAAGESLVSTRCQSVGTSRGDTIRTQTSPQSAFIQLSDRESESAASHLYCEHLNKTFDFCCCQETWKSLILSHSETHTKTVNLASIQLLYLTVCLFHPLFCTVETSVRFLDILSNK